jgi:hypothetical protein
MILDTSPRSATLCNDASSKLSSESADLMKFNQSKLQTHEQGNESSGSIAANSATDSPAQLLAKYPDSVAKKEIAGSGKSTGHDDDPNDKWVIPDLAHGAPPLFGLKGGMQFGFYPAGLGNDGGPRGLIRMWSPFMPEGQYLLSNYIAIEPTVKGNPDKGFSELENGADGQRGKIITADPDSVKVKTIAPGVQELDVTCDVEKFNNGAHVILDISQRSDHPDEVQFKVHQAADSAPIDNCVLTATWGNLTRSRQLWLKDGAVSTQDIPSYRDYTGNDFAPDQFFPIDKMSRLPNGLVGVGMTTDEADPASVHPLPWPTVWDWHAGPITQYWEAPDADKDLQVRLNARHNYWASSTAIPGGTAFENFELRQPFHDGQALIYGASTKTPTELGYGQKK